MVLSLQKVSKNFQQMVALQEVDLEIPSNSIFALLGPNGAGKTTLLRIITAIFAPDSGKILFNGKPISSTNKPIIGYLPEERGLYKKMKVGEQLVYLAQLRGLSFDEANKNLKHWLTKLDIADREFHIVESLSKGLQQKVQFIATIIHNPDIVILDEPFSGFDPINAQLIKNEILEMKKNGKTVIISTHRMESVEELCDEIALLHKGKLILRGNKETIKKSFSKNQYLIKGIGEASVIKDCAIIENYKQNNLTKLLININESQSVNDVLLTLIHQGFQVHFIEEQLPSMHAIFIEKINTYAQ